MTIRVVVLGDVATDVVVRTLEEVSADSDTASSVSQDVGGAGANVTSWLAWSGTAVRLVGSVGDDLSGRAHADALRSRGIDVRLARDRDAPTGTVVVVVTPDGRRTMFPDRGANLLVRPDHAVAALEGASHLHVSGYALLHPRPRAAARAAIGAACRAGMSVSVDPSSVAPLRTAGAEAFLDWTRGLDMCLPNIDEALELTGLAEAGAAVAALGSHYGEAVVTAGADAALWSDGHDQSAVAPQRVKVVDPTGAGDAFAAGFLGARLRGAPPDEALRRGHVAAAVAVSRPGAMPPATPDKALRTSRR